jgi:hypothetical protein
VWQHVNAFLEDEKKGFILVGKSGVGKSKFLLTLADELQKRSNTCVLMYHGTQLILPEKIDSNTLTDVITMDVIPKDYKDRNDYGTHEIPPRQSAQQVWDEINATIPTDGVVVFCIDAVNENTRPTDLLIQLDGLVRKRFSWLKVIFSSRVETWQQIKRGPGVSFAEALYYRAPTTRRWGTERFSYSERMEPFSSAELLTAYGKYQKVFGIQTDYDSLSTKLREIILDPTNLWLLLKQHEGEAIPPTAKTSAQLIEGYVSAMEKNGDPDEPSPGPMRQFLEEEVVPLMVRDGYYDNGISDTDLKAAGNAKKEMFYDDQKNQEFLRLRDAGILELVGQKTEEGRIEPRIKFKHERFYEHFIGRELARIADLKKKQDDRYAFFVELIEETTRKPFFGELSETRWQKRPEIQTPRRF